MKKIGIIIGITSFVIIAYQLALMRYLSIVQFHHYAYMIISIALLGFGASGTFLFIFRKFLLQYYENVMFVLTVSFLLLILFSSYILNFLSFDPFLVIWDIRESITILLFYAVIFLPFFTAATILGLSFMKYPDLINKYYFYNLAGSAVGGIGALTLMDLIDPFTLIIAISGFLLINLLFCIGLLKKILLTFSVFLICGFLFSYFYFSCSMEVNISEYKSLMKVTKFPDAKIIHDDFNSQGWICLLSSNALRYAPGLSLNFTGNIPRQIGVFNDAELIGTILKDKNSDTDFLNKSTLTLPYLLKGDANVLIIGSGPGIEILRAINNNAKFVTGVEINLLVNSIAKKFLNEFLKEDNKKRFQILTSEGRGFLNQTNEKFDVIYFPLMEGFSATAGGYYSLFENYLLTVESVSKAIDKLNDDGILCLNTWTNSPPRHAIKMFSLLINAIKKLNYKNPHLYVIAIRSWSTVTVIFKKSEFNESDIQLVKRFCDVNSFDIIYHPDIKQNETNKYNFLNEDIYFSSLNSLLFEKSTNLVKDYIFNISAPTDDQPYFSNFIKVDQLVNILTEYGLENFPLYEWGYLLLLITLVQILILSVSLIIIPLLFTRRGSVNWKIKIKVFLYFSGIGIGFMFIEIFLIQKFILFLSHPIYSVSMVISSVLFFAGIGSLLSTKFAAHNLFNIRLVVSILLILLVVYYFALPVIYEFFIHLPLAIKYIFSFMMIAPLAFCMGMLFPIGIRILSKTDENLIPWAWGINGCSSVLSSVLAPILSIEFGFNFLLLVSGFAYTILVIIGTKFKRKGE